MDYQTPGLSRMLNDHTCLVVREDMPEEAVASAYLQYQADGLLETIFYEGVPTLMWWMNWYLRHDNNRLLGVYLINTPTDEKQFIGCGWINSVTRLGDYSKAEVGMGFFREFMNPGLTQAAGLLMAQYCFDRVDLDAIFGTTPVQNKAALSWTNRVGFEHSTPIKGFTVWRGEPTDVIISHMTRKRWEIVKEALRVGS